MGARHDVLICGGGLAGLTLARQLHRRRPDLDVAVLDRSERPLPEACHKVGESSVEVGTHYLANVLGLKDYLDREHLPKNGLRFYCGDSTGPFARRTEIGPGEFPPVPSYQMDRGKLENDLRAMVDEHATLHEGWSVQAIDLDDDGPHRVRAKRSDGAEETLEARWVVDATGRRRLLRSALGLARDSEIRASAAWFRVGGRVVPSDLVPESESAWHQRDHGGDRWLSTNHLCGPGYWVWLIPLSTGHTSVGIVVDASFHDYLTIHKEEPARAWLAEHEPLVAERLADVPFEDFAALHHYSYGGERFVSEYRWALVGEAAFFVDPLYSPGTDFIAYTNSYVTEAIAEDAEDALDPKRLEAFHEVVLPMARDLERTLGGLGTVFQHPDVFAAKLWWDYFIYWAFMAAYFFHRGYEADADGQAPFVELRGRYEALNRRVQTTLKAWAELKQHPTWKPRDFVPLPMGVSSLTELHLELQRPKGHADNEARMRRDLAEAEVMAAEILYRALIGVGPDRAAELGAEVELDRWDIAFDEARVGAEEAPRGVRRGHLPRTGRDLERAIGRCPSNGTPLATLLAIALGKKRAA